GTGGSLPVTTDIADAYNKLDGRISTMKQTLGTIDPAAAGGQELINRINQNLLEAETQIADLQQRYNIDPNEGVATIPSRESEISPSNSKTIAETIKNRIADGSITPPDKI